MTYGLVVTAAGMAAMAADLGGGADLVITHVAFGDANGVPYTPNVNQVALVNERYRSTVASVAVVEGEIVIDAIIPADTPDASARPSHSFSVAEAAIIGTSGGTPLVIGIARMGNGFKPGPSTGQAVTATFRFQMAVANPSAIIVAVDPAHQIILGRHVRSFWVTVDGVLSAPPVSPAIGATYVIGPAPTGAWSGFAGYLAQWVGVWSLSNPPDGHIVSNNSVASNDAGRYRQKAGAVWGNWYADSNVIGPILRATDAVALAGQDTASSISPRQLSLVQQRAPFVLATVGGTANAITLTLTPAPAAYTTGMLVTFAVATTNTGPVDVNINNLGFRDMTRADRSELNAGEMLAGQMVSLIYDGTAFQMVNFAGGDTTRPTGFVGTFSQSFAHNTQADITAYTAVESNLGDATLSSGVLTVGPKSAGLWAVAFSVVSPSSNVELLGVVMDAASGGAGVGYGTSQTAAGAPGCTAITYLRRTNGQSIRAQARYVQAAFGTLTLTGRLHAFRVGA